MFSKYVKDIYLQGMGNAVAQLIGVLTIPILTRLFTPEQYGALNLFTNVVAFLSIIITFRFEYLILLDKYESVALNIISLILRFGVILSVAFFFIILTNKSTLVSLFKLEQVSSYLYFAPFSALLISISVSVQQFQQRKQKYFISGVSEVVNKLGVLFFTVIVFFVFRTTLALILSSSFGIALKIIYLSNKDELIKNSWFSLRKKIALISFKKYWKSSLSFSISNTLLFITGHLPVYFITKYYGMKVLGNWSLMIMALYLPTSVIGNAIGQVFYERAAKLNAEGYNFNKLWVSTIKSLLLISIPSFLIIAFISPYIFSTFFGNNWQLAGEYASIFSIAACLSFICTPVDKACYIINRWQYPYIYNSLRLLFVIISFFIAQRNEFTFKEFLWLHVFQTSLIYCFDLLMSFYFSKKVTIIKNYI